MGARDKNHAAAVQTFAEQDKKISDLISRIGILEQKIAQISQQIMELLPLKSILMGPRGTGPTGP